MKTMTRMAVAALAACVACAAWAAEKPATEGAEVGKWTMDAEAAKAKDNARRAAFLARMEEKAAAAAAQAALESEEAPQQ